jgi:hypothetical protein
MGNWYDDPTTVGRDRLRAILAGIEAPPPPLTRGQQVRLLVIAYHARGCIEFCGFPVSDLAHLRQLLAGGHVRGDGDYGLVEEAFWCVDR